MGLGSNPNTVPVTCRLTNKLRSTGRVQRIEKSEGICRKSVRWEGNTMDLQPTTINESSPYLSSPWRAMNDPLPLFQGRRSHLAWACSKSFQVSARNGPPVWDFAVGVRQVLTTHGLRVSASYYVGMYIGVLPYAATAGRSINSDLGLRRRTVASQVCARNKIFMYIDFSQTYPDITFSIVFFTVFKKI